MSSRSVLVVDDEPDIRNLLQEILEDEGYAVSVAESASAAQSCIDEQTPDLVLLDIWMPDTDGISLLKTWRKSGDLQFPVIMISGHGTVETAVEATRHGAVDFIEKPVSLAKLLLNVEKALADGFEESVAGKTPTPVRRLPLLLGDSDYIVKLRELLDAQAATTNTLLLIGEPGSGRVLFSQHVHDKSSENPGPFVQLRCDTLSAANSHRELLGEETNGSVSMGFLESASDGTLFLSDTELLPTSAQQCLRQAIEQQGFVRVGGDVRVPFRARLMASSRTELSSQVKQGVLDPSLARQLAAEVIEIKPLREHPEDIPALLEGFVDWHVDVEGLTYRHFSVGAQNKLRNLDWPGNLLELKNLVQRILLLGGPVSIEAAEVSNALGIVASSDTMTLLRYDLPLREARADFERQYLIRCLTEAQGNIGDLAKHVGMERTHLYRKLRSLIVDTDKSVLAELGSRLDLNTVVGYASYPEVLRRAGAEDADMIIAATDSDETNIVAIQIAYTLFKTPNKIARIRSTDYLREKDLFSNNHIPINVLVSPEQLVTDHIQRVIEHPGALQVVDFAGGRVRLVGVEVQKGSPMENESLSHLPDLLDDIDMRVMAVYRGDKAIIPEGKSVIKAEDIVFILSQRVHTAKVMAQFHNQIGRCKRVMIAGGGNIGLQLARKLEKHYDVKIIETKEARADYLAETLNNALVFHGDAADQDMLIDENIEDMDVFCALTNDDEANILSAMLAKRMGANKIMSLINLMSLINRPAYVDLVERGIIDVAISPQQITIGSLLTHIRRGDVVAVHSLRKGSAEALEGIAHGDKDTSVLVGREIGQVELPKSATIGVIARGNDVLIAHHDTVIEAEDHLIVLITDKREISDVEKLFQVGFTFV